MPQNALPSGYHEVPAPGQGEPPPGYHVVSGPQGIPENYGFTEENASFGKMWGDVKELASGAYGMGKDILLPEGKTEADKLSWLAHKYIFDPSDIEMQKARTAPSGWESVGHSIAGSIPLIGPWAASLGEQAGTGDIGGAVRKAVVQVGAAKAASAIPGKVGALASRTKEGAIPAMRTALGVGPEFTEAAVKEQAGKVADVTEANRAALNKARTGEETFQSKVEAAQQANEAAKQTAIDKQQLQTEVVGHAKELGNHLADLKESEKAFGKSLYPEIDGTADAREMQGKLQNAIDSNLRGTDKPPMALARIVKELEPENPLAQASVFRGSGSVSRSIGGKVNIEELPQAVQDRIMRQMQERAGYEPPTSESTVGKSLTFDQMHGYYSELGEELGKDLSGDERASVTAARAELLGEMRKMAEGQGKLGQFTEAQKNWSKYENTFNKTWSDKRGVASPIAKALSAKDPVSGELLPDRVAQLLGKDQNYKLAQQMLSRYGAAKPELLQLMKEKMDQAGGMPKGVKETPVPERNVTPVNFKAPPPTIDIAGLKNEAIQKKMAQLGGFSGRGMFIDAASLVHFLTTGNPVALAIPIGRRLLAKAIKSGAKSGALVGVTPEEAAMLKSVDQGATPASIRPSQVFPTKAAAKAALRGSKTTPTEWESDEEMARRGAPGTNPVLKSIRRHYE